MTDVVVVDSARAKKALECVEELSKRLKDMENSPVIDDMSPVELRIHLENYGFAK